jgi:hypothetical protein
MARLNRSVRDPNLRFVDLDGDGHADVLITEDEAFTWHQSSARKASVQPSASQGQDYSTNLHTHTHTHPTHTSQHQTTTHQLLSLSLHMIGGVHPRGARH